MPWPTETNRKRLRAYGGVHKGAAVRYGIYIDVEGSKLWMEARGNNIRGFKRTRAYFDAEALELRLVDPRAQEEADEQVDTAVLEWLESHPGRHSTKTVRESVGKRAKSVDSSLERLKARDDVCDSSRDGGRWSGRRGAARYWIASVHAAETSSQLFGTMSDDEGAGGPESATSSASSHPRRGDDVAWDHVSEEAQGLPGGPAT
jgi:hypothetical protein